LPFLNTTFSPPFLSPRKALQQPPGPRHSTRLEALASKRAIGNLRAAASISADGKAKDSYGKTAFDYAQDNEKLKGTDAYWKLNEARY
jgi:hypothetical protein